MRVGAKHPSFRQKRGTTSAFVILERRCRGLRSKPGGVGTPKNQIFSGRGGACLLVMTGAKSPSVFEDHAR
jgi:hypothetical protein